MEQTTITNYGLDLEKEIADQSEKDWIFGSSSPVCIASIPETQRLAVLPSGEVQKGREDTMDCASRAPVNILETKFNWLFNNDHISSLNKSWLIENGYFTDYGIVFSDAFVAINSGTTRSGNSLKAPCEAIRTMGLIPKPMLPLEPWMTWEDYHNTARITDEMYALGLEFLRRFTINYERVLEQDYSILIDEDLLDVGGYAWTKPDATTGIYPRTDKNPNHAFVVVKSPVYTIFDNYIDKHDGDYIKLLANDYNLLDYGYRILISAEHNVDIDDDEPVEDYPLELLPVTDFWKWLGELVKKIFPKIKTV
jgi:hypothetical protein